MLRDLVELTLEELEQWLQRVPVFATVHPLVPLCLGSKARIVTQLREIQRIADDLSNRFSEPVLILGETPPRSLRFPRVTVPACPTPDEINHGLADNLTYARTHLLTTRKVAEHIAFDVAQNHFDTVVVLFVDGLSYQDVQDWPCELQPCFVDGPSVTYRFATDVPKKLMESVGFPAIVGKPTIYTRLYKQGFRNARGYTYWDRDNVVADYMFEGIPYDRVQNFESVLELLTEEPTLKHTYVQIMREGLDGLAHSKRELRRVEIDASIRGILRDVDLLQALLQERQCHAVIYVTADHGILWKTEHAFRITPTAPSRHPRYSSEIDAAGVSDAFTIPFNQDGVVYHLYKYPFLGTAIRANDSGVHGGLSYQESIVPFAKFEVKPKWN